MQCSLSVMQEGRAICSFAVEKHELCTRICYLSCRNVVREIWTYVPLLLPRPVQSRTLQRTSYYPAATWPLLNRISWALSTGCVTSTVMHSTYSTWMPFTLYRPKIGNSSSEDTDISKFQSPGCGPQVGASMTSLFDMSTQASPPTPLPRLPSRLHVSPPASCYDVDDCSETLTLP